MSEGCPTSPVSESPKMVPDNALVLVLVGDDHRYAGCVYHGGADRAEQHSGESAAAMAADHDELGRLGFVEQMAGRVIDTQPDGGR